MVATTEHMFEAMAMGPAPAASAPSASALSCGGADSLAGLVRMVRGLAPAADSAEQIDQIRLLEQLASAVAAASARVTAAFATSRRAERVAAGAPAERAGEDVAAQVGLAKGISPFSARRYVGWASVLVAELPETLTALTEGTTTEWRAMIVARETGWLSLEHRAEIDRELAPTLGSLGNRRGGRGQGRSLPARPGRLRRSNPGRRG